MWVVIIGILWEIFEVYVEGTEETWYKETMDIITYDYLLR